MEDWLTAFHEEKQRQGLNNLPLFFSDFFALCLPRLSWNQPELKCARLAPVTSPWRRRL